jgi:hypothetical protein
MLRISLLELLMKGIPEGIISVFGIFTLSKTKLNLKKFFYLSLSLIVLTYLFRFLPIDYSVHIFVSVATIIIVPALILQIHFLKAIKAGLIIIVIIIINECTTFCILNMVFLKDRVCQIMNNPFSKSIAGTPSTILFAIIIFIIYVNYYKKMSTKEI